MNEELKVCPKCKSNECKTVNTVDNDPRIVFDFWHVSCLACRLASGSFDTEKQAVNDWNKRTTDPRIKQVIEEIDNDFMNEPEDDLDRGAWQQAEHDIEILRKHFPELKESNNNG